jgi:toxin ParE1/3/4
MKVVWSRRAVLHLARVRDYIANDDPQAAAEIARRILEGVERLALNPHLGRSGRIVGTRELVVSGTSYIVPYRTVSRANAWNSSQFSTADRSGPPNSPGDVVGD